MAPKRESRTIARSGTNDGVQPSVFQPLHMAKDEEEISANQTVTTTEPSMLKSDNSPNKPKSIQSSEPGEGTAIPPLMAATNQRSSVPTNSTSPTQLPSNALKNAFSAITLPTTVAVCSFIALVFFVTYRADHLGRLRIKMNQKQLESAIDMFPKNPLEYNIKQRQLFIQSGNLTWRRYNFMAIGVLAICGTIGATLKVWHRKRRTVILRRKSLFFWAFTSTAASLVTFYGAYMMKRGSTGQQIMQQVNRNPAARGIVYLSGVAILGLLLMMNRIYMAKPHKKQHHGSLHNI